MKILSIENKNSFLELFVFDGIYEVIRNGEVLFRTKNYELARESLLNLSS
jgi:hypothetical protein